MDIIFGQAVALNWNAPGDGGNAVRVQLSPFGEFTLNDGGRKDGTVQHCTRAAFEAMVANWREAGSPDILVDVDHASARGGTASRTPAAPSAFPHACGDVPNSISGNALQANFPPYLGGCSAESLGEGRVISLFRKSLA